jgi:hypothetical protein
MIKICPILSLSEAMSKTVGCNDGSVQCQRAECMFFNIGQDACIISGQKPELEQEDDYG